MYSLHSLARGSRPQEGEALIERGGDRHAQSMFPGSPGFVVNQTGCFARASKVYRRDRSSSSVMGVYGELEPWLCQSLHWIGYHHTVGRANNSVGVAVRVGCRRGGLAENGTEIEGVPLGGAALSERTAPSLGDECRQVDLRWHGASSCAIVTTYEAYGAMHREDAEGEVKNSPSGARPVPGRPYRGAPFHASAGLSRQAPLGLRVQHRTRS